MAYNYGSPITGTIGSGGSAVVQLPNSPMPVTLVLASAAGGREIQLSFDGGLTYFVAVTPTLTNSGEIVYALNYPCTHVKFTGASGDVYYIIS